ncbi:hypothetical protein QYF61_003937 [Mycteria americana]|uniref:Zona-pellucida-binding protein 1/2 C-terminal domain-containing protein n=1 Tax=Mycteria americana TaxID=33587 RepID=A0AAN7SFF5_MYCAM|nr:hypothetical protein QYF61_003937 [Mycteria americana]
MTCSITFPNTEDCLPRDSVNQAPKQAKVCRPEVQVASLDGGKHNGLCQQSACDASHRLNKAKHVIERFFKQQVEVSRKSSEPLPEIYYIEGTLQMVQVDRCYPGYGINALIHPDCPECCGK